MTGSDTAHKGTVWTISPGMDVVAALVDGLLQRYGDGGDFRLSDITLLLPTQRACRAVRAAFLRQAPGGTTLLPRLMPLGDLDDDAVYFSSNTGLAANILNLPPPISPLARQWQLARLLRIVEPDLPFVQQCRLAAELGRLLDQWQTEDLDTSKLHDLPEERFASHWQKTLRILSVILDHWPEVLDEQGMIDPARHRNLMMATQGDFWRAQPPAGPVIAAGSTGSLPATGRLLATIASLPNGHLVLPGLDQQMPDAAWSMVEEQHPQYMLKRLLERLKITRQDVLAWPGRAPIPPGSTTSLDDRNARMHLLSLAMLPAAATPLWQEPAFRTLNIPVALRGITRIDAATAEEEAQTIALIMRSVLQEQNRTAILVTPDRTLGRRVAAMMGRWGIVLDDSAGVPLSETALGSWLRQLVRYGLCPDDQRRAVDLLALLYHPLAGLGMRASDRLRLVRHLELNVLRGPAITMSWTGIRQAILAQSQQSSQHLDDELLEMIDTLHADFKGLEAFRTRSDPDFAALIRCHGQLAEHLARTDTTAGAARCWIDPAGEAAAGFFSDIQSALTGAPQGHARDYPDLLDGWLQAIPVRVGFGDDPRLAIWGPLEARLQQADVMILGGLNEGTWPAAPAADAWLSRPMRQQLGLPTTEKRIGQSAHDFMAAFGADELFLTRAVRQDKAPSVPSRWLQRLDAVLQILHPAHITDNIWLPGQHLWLERVRSLDYTARPTPVCKPSPMPALSLRPTQLRVTDLEMLLTDPYDFYAKNILKLYPLDAIAMPPDHLERGTLIHAILEQLIRDWIAAGGHADWWHLARLPVLLSQAEDALTAQIDDPVIRAFWMPRLRQVLTDLYDWQLAAAQIWQPLAVEEKGQCPIGTQDHHQRVLVGRADRIDRSRDHPDHIRIIDYKTGTLATKKKLINGQRPQLALLAVMAMRGGFLNAVKHSTSMMLINVGNGFKHVEIAALEAETARINADDGLDRIMAFLDNPKSCFIATGAGYSDYHHLARLDEWGAEDDDDDSTEVTS